MVIPESIFRFCHFCCLWVGDVGGSAWIQSREFLETVILTYFYEPSHCFSAPSRAALMTLFLLLFSQMYTCTYIYTVSNDGVFFRLLFQSTSNHVHVCSSADVTTPTHRYYSQQPGPGSLPDYQTVDPYRLLEDDLKDVYSDIRKVSLHLFKVIFLNIPFGLCKWCTEINVSPTNSRGNFSLKWTIFYSTELQFLGQFRNDVCIIVFPMPIHVFTDELEFAVPNCRMKSK